MGLVAITADDAGAIHGTLYEGTVDVDLVADLSVEVIKGIFQQAKPVCIEQVVSVLVLAQCASAGMAAAAAFDLLGARQCCAALCNCFARCERPGSSLGQRQGKPAVSRRLSMDVPELPSADDLPAVCESSVKQNTMMLCNCGQVVWRAC